MTDDEVAASLLRLPYYRQAPSWILILFVAPTIFVILVWLVGLLRQCQRQRQRKPTSLLISCQHPSLVKHKHNQDQSKIVPSCKTDVTSNTEHMWLIAFGQQTQHYLLALVYQEMVTCLICFSLAILNLIQVRNLFCCNSILFILLANKLLFLFSLSSYAISKLLHLLAAPATLWLAPLALDKSAPGNREASSGQRAKLQLQPPQGPQRLDASATISRLIERGGDDGGEPSDLPASKAATSGKPARLGLAWLALISCVGALACLYLRWMSADMVVVVVGNSQQTATTSAASANHSAHLRSIYTPAKGTTTTTTTEASARYVSDLPMLETSPSSALWPATQQAATGASSKLRQLADKYELELSFLRLLADTRLQTSRFACNLSPANFGLVARYTLLAVYGSLGGLLLVLWLAIYALGARRVRLVIGRQQVRALAGSSSSSLASSSSSSPSSSSLSLSRCESLRQNKNPSSKRYRELLKQQVRGQAKRRLRGSSSLCSLVAQQHQQQQQHQQHQQQQVFSARFGPPASRHSTQQHLQRRLLVGAASLDDVARSNSGGGNQPAWLPFGSAATVASLSNIAAAAAGSLERCPTPLEFSPFGRPKEQQLQVDDSQQERGHLSAIFETASGRHKPHGETQVSLAASNNNKTVNDDQDGQRRWRRLSLGQDLRLCLWLILFGQLLNHAPVLVSSTVRVTKVYGRRRRNRCVKMCLRRGWPVSSSSTQDQKASCFSVLAKSSRLRSSWASSALRCN